MDIPPTPETPQFVGTAPKGLFSESKCSKTVCKYLIPVLGGLAIILLVIILVRVLGKKKDGNTPAPPPTAGIKYAYQPPRETFGTIQQQPPVKPYPRNVPLFNQRPDGSQYPPQASPTLQQAMGSPFYQGGQQASGGNPEVAKMLDQRYQQVMSQPYNDMKMAAYNSYSEQVNSQHAVQSLNEEAFNKRILQQREPALVAFTMQGCGFCEKMKPNFAEAAKNAKITLAVVDRADAGQLLQKFSIQGFPTIILFRGGEAVKKYNGDRSAASLAEFANA